MKYVDESSLIFMIFTVV